MMKSKKPEKQRKLIFNAPLHRRQKMLAAHLSKELIQKWKKRSLAVRKGDEVKVMRGEFRKTTGKVIRVNLRRLQVFVDNVKRRKVSGQEIHVPINPSNLLLVNPVMEDKERLRIINRKGEKA